MRDNKGRFIKGNQPIFSKEHREKLRLSKIGEIYTEERNKKVSRSLMGRKIPLQTRLKMSEARKGSKSPLWKGGVSAVNRTKRQNIMSSMEYKLWRTSVFERDGYTCIWCGFKGYVEADHIKPFALFPELRFAIDNGRTLCKPCHNSVTYVKRK